MRLRFRLPVKPTSIISESFNDNAVRFVHRDLERWSTQYNIPYTTTREPHYLYVDFESASMQSWFLLTYSPVFKSSRKEHIEFVDVH